MRTRLEQRDLYNYIRGPRIRLLLEACELDVRDPMRTETIALPAALSIEHAMPQSWEEYWPLLPDASEEDRLNRDAHVHRLGNLTLVTQALNSGMSNWPWQGADGMSKRAELRRRSLLLINQRLCQHDDWNEQLIDERGHDLAERVLRTWPGPDSDIWAVAPRSGAQAPS